MTFTSRRLVEISNKVKDVLNAKKVNITTLAPKKHVNSEQVSDVEMTLTHLFHQDSP